MKKRRKGFKGTTKNVKKKIKEYNENLKKSTDKTVVPAVAVKRKVQALISI